MAAAEKRIAYRTTQQRNGLVATLLIYVLVWAVVIAEVAAADGGSWTRRGIGIAVISAHLLVVIWFAAEGNQSS